MAVRRHWSLQSARFFRDHFASKAGLIQRGYSPQIMEFKRVGSLRNHLGLDADSFNLSVVDVDIARSGPNQDVFPSFKRSDENGPSIRKGEHVLDVHLERAVHFTSLRAWR